MEEMTITAVPQEELAKISEETFTHQGKVSVLARTAKTWGLSQYGIMVELIKPVKELRKVVVNDFKDPKAKTRSAWQAVCDLEKSKLEPIDAIIDMGTKAINEYLLEEQKRKREAEEKARKEAEAQAAKEREKLLAQAAKADSKGKAEQAERLLEEAEDVYVQPIAEVQAQTTVKTGNATAFAQMETEIQVTDLEAFVKALVEQGIKPTMLDVKVAPLKAWVKALGLKRFPGLAIREVPKARIR